MTSLPNDPADPAVTVRTNDYDAFAEAYSAENESSLYNAYYERPAMLELAGDVARVPCPLRCANAGP